MISSITPSEADVFTALRAFLLTVVPGGSAVMVGSIAAGVLTIEKRLGTDDQKAAAINLGDSVLGLNIASGTIISGPLVLNGSGQPTYIVTPSQDADSTTISTGAEVIQAQLNRSAEPVAADFMTMTLVRAPRLATNVDSKIDCVFSANISGSVMTVDSIETGAIEVGATVFGPGVAPGTNIRAQLGNNIYSVTPSQNITQERLAASRKKLTQKAQVAIQLDVHGPNSTDFALAISTAFRDAYATELFAALNPLISPLYADDPRQLPFVNSEQQYEDRWVIEDQLQVDYSVSVSQQYADTLTIVPVSVEATFPV